MSNDLNCCTLIGRLGRDPEIKSTAGGTDVANFSIASNWKYKDNEGVEWTDCVAFGGLAKVVGDYAQKGTRVMVQGPKRTREWEGRDGNKRRSVEIHVQQFQLLGGDQVQAAPASGGSGQLPPESKPAKEQGVTDDDIPF